MAKRGAVGKLAEHHLKAIQLIEEGKHTMKDIANAVGLAVTTLYDLYEGSERAGVAGQLFYAEIQKITKKNKKKMDELMGENKVLAMRIMNDCLKRKMALDYQNDDDVKLVTSIHNSLAKASVGVEINNTSYSYTKGLSAEDLMHEFNKLSSIAKGASVRRGVQKLGSGVARLLSKPSEPGSGNDQESEDPDLRSDA